ncbi:MAG: gluconate kinase [Flavobacteriaceae bacterium]|nr:gluconate kinase [Flavobacteriaceae bacterium]|tara:strand:- start:22492 stop:22962 length:471 start_codon:yes stop_codon:yes gene_type:complete
MGVSGCGKTTVGTLLANRLNAPFYDADDFHPESNVLKMQQGTSLNDSDRKPWLETLATNIQKWSTEGEAVLACSALKRSYRDMLDSNRDAFWVFLQGGYPAIYQRLQQRTDHYMPPALLQSQFDALEPPTKAFRVSVTRSPEHIVDDILSKYQSYE